LNDAATFVLGSLAAAGILFAFWLVFKPNETSSTRAQEESHSNAVPQKWHIPAQKEPERQEPERRGKGAPAFGNELTPLTVSESERMVVERTSVPWTETLREMGLTDVLNGFSLNEVSGQYRNRNVTIGQPISEKPEPLHSDHSEYYSCPIIDPRTKFTVEFKNTPTILLSIVSRSLHDHSKRAQFDSSLEKDFTQIYLNSFQNEEFDIIGNKQRETDIVIDSSILDKLERFKNTLYLLEIGRGTRTSAGIESEIEPNIILYVDSEPLERMRLAPLKAKLIVDTLVDIAENIERLPSTISAFRH